MLAPDRRWTQSDITLLRDRLGTGTEFAALADLLQRCPAAVTPMMYRLRLRG